LAKNWELLLRISPNSNSVPTQIISATIQFDFRFWILDFGLGNWASGIGHRAEKHWALGIGHGAWGIGNWALAIGPKSIGPW
jgi:hypothetical protein